MYNNTYIILLSCFINAVATHVGNRTGVQCANRFHALGTATISSRQNTGRWSEEERQVQQPHVCTE